MAGESSPTLATENHSEPAHRRLALLVRASEELGASLDVEATARGLVGLLVPSLADHAIVDLVDVDASGTVTVYPLDAIEHRGFDLLDLDAAPRSSPVRMLRQLSTAWRLARRSSDEPLPRVG